MENYEVRMRERPGTFLMEIYFICKMFDGKIGVLVLGKDGFFDNQSFDRGVAIPPSMILPRDIISQMMEVFVKEGFKLPDESFIKGKLDATESHLKDLRTLLKLK